VRRFAACLLVVLGAVVIAGCGAGGLGDQHAATTVPPPADRKAAPQFSAPALDGHGRVDLASLRGHPAVLNFWASWCGPCTRETPELVSFARSHPNVRVLGLAVTDKPSASRAFARKYHVGYPLGIDRSGDVGNRYGIPGLPSTFILDRDGRIVSTWYGPIDVKDLDLLVAQLGT
jgi:peroxiredoxin